jgi:tetratricopeptide (TPR) repeat protein
VTHLAEAGETHYRGLAHWVLAHHLLSLGRFAQALESVAQIAAIAERLREPRLYSFAAAGALVRATMGDWEEAVRQCEQTMERATDAVADVLILSSLGFAHSQGGDPDRAIDCLQRAIARMRSLDVLRISETRFGAFLADAYLARGDVARARQEAAAALALAKEMGYPWGGALAERALGRAAHAAGDAGTAVAHLDAARERFAALEGAFEAARTAFYLADALHALGRPEESAAAVGEARRAFGGLGVPVWERRAADLARRIARPG